MTEESTTDVSFDIEQIDVSDLELGEVEQIEEYVGTAASDINWGSAKALAALVWVMERRTNPAYTLEEARKIKMSAFNSDNGDGPPTGEAPEAESTPAAAGDPS